MKGIQRAVRVKAECYLGVNEVPALLEDLQATGEPDQSGPHDPVEDVAEITVKPRQVQFNEKMPLVSEKNGGGSPMFQEKGIKKGVGPKENGMMRGGLKKEGESKPGQTFCERREW
jgi:hypothetical protein